MPIRRGTAPSFQKACGTPAETCTVVQGPARTISPPGVSVTAP
jgi:hypothetical protein